MTSQNDWYVRESVASVVPELAADALVEGVDGVVEGDVVVLDVVVLDAVVLGDPGGADVAGADVVVVVDDGGVVDAPAEVAAIAKNSAPVAMKDAATVVLCLVSVRLCFAVTRPVARVRAFVFVVLMSILRLSSCAVRLHRLVARTRPALVAQTACSDGCALPEDGAHPARDRPRTVATPSAFPIEPPCGRRLRDLRVVRARRYKVRSGYASVQVNRMIGKARSCTVRCACP